MHGGHDPYCGNCTYVVRDPRKFGRCSRHHFVIPAVDDLVICRDWQPAFPMEDLAFRGSLEPGVLYRWDVYSYAKAVDRFERLTEFRFDRRWGLFENPANGWSIQISVWDHELFPSPGQPLEMQMDEVKVPFAVRDAPVTTTDTGRSASGELMMEDRTQITRILLPADGHQTRLVAWIERHYDLSESRRFKAESQQHPRMMYKDKVLNLPVRIVGTPDRGLYELLPLRDRTGDVLAKIKPLDVWAKIKSLFG